MFDVSRMHLPAFPDFSAFVPGFFQGCFTALCWLLAIAGMAALLVVVVFAFVMVILALVYCVTWLYKALRTLITGKDEEDE